MGALTLAVPAVAGTVVALPWYLKNWLVFGNPVYPVYFGGVGWSADRLKLFQESFAGFGFGHSIPDYLALLPNMLFYPGRFTLDPPGLISALLLAAPFACLVRRRDPAIWALAAISLLQFAFWSTGMQETRFLLPILPWVSALSAVVIARGIQAQRPAIGATVKVLCVASVIPLLVIQLRPSILDGLRVVVGLDSRREYVADRFDEYPSIAFINESLPPDAKVLLLWRNRGYYLQRAYVPDDFYDRFRTLYGEEGSLSGVFIRLRNMDVTHVLVNTVDLPVWESDPGNTFYADVRLFREFQGDYLDSLRRFDRDELLALKKE